MLTPPMFEIAYAGASPSVRATETEFKRFMGIPEEGQGVPRSLKEFGRQPADEAWVFKCVHIKAMATQAAPLRVEVKDGKAWVPLEAKPDPAGEDLQFLLDDVNPAWEGAQLQAYTSAGGSVHGGCYWLLVKGRLGGIPREIHWLSGALVEPVMGRTFPEEYIYSPQGTGERYRYPADRIVPFRDTVNLEDPYKLLSPLASARFEISASKQAAEWNDALLRNWGIPAGAWTAAPNAEIGAQDRSFIKRALRALRGPANQGKQPVLPAGLTWTQLGMSQKDADWIAGRKVSRMTICTVLGVPLVLAGDDEKASVYASTRDAERVFWRETMINELDHRAVPINSFLVPFFDPTRKRLRVAYDYTGVEALRGAPTEEMGQWLEAVKAGLPLNRYIKQFGMGDPVEGGDEAYKMQKDAERQAEQAAKQAEAIAEKKSRSEEYDTPRKSGAEPAPAGDRVRALGRGLYRHPAVRAFVESGDTSGLVPTLVDAWDLDDLTAALRRRDPARKIADLLDDKPPVDKRMQELEQMVTRTAGGMDAALLVVAQAARLIARANKPRKVIRTPVRDETGRIISVEEVEM